MCESSDGWLVAWDLCECVLILSSAMWLLPFLSFVTIFSLCS